MKAHQHDWQSIVTLCSTRGNNGFKPPHKLLFRLPILHFSASVFLLPGQVVESPAQTSAPGQVPQPPLCSRGPHRALGTRAGTALQWDPPENAPPNSDTWVMHMKLKP